MNVKVGEPEWKVNTAALLKEIAQHTSEAGALRIPLQIFGNILSELGEVAAEINHPVLNHYMCRLAIYAEADKYSGCYDKKKVDRVRREAAKYLKNQKKENANEDKPTN